MPELPEVETTRRGIAPHLLGRTVKAVTVRQPRLRWPVPAELQQMAGRRITAVERRAKYILLTTPAGSAIVHLGMSGSLRIVTAANAAPRKHDHVDIAVTGGRLLRLHDPRRFGAVLWTTDPPMRHPLLSPLGPEPLGEHFDGDYLYTRSRGKRVPVKQFIMDGRVVVGVGNIYASEALFLAGISPLRAAGRTALPRYRALAECIRQVLSDAIAQGGTTLRDFVNSDGQPGYFLQQLKVYGRQGQPCRACGTTVKTLRLAQRSTYYCPRCQR